MSKIILVLGGSGMLGSSLHRYFTKCTDFSVVSTVRSESARLKLASMGFESVISGVDVTNKDILEGTFIDVKPDYVFNCIGLIKQLSESKVETQAVKINSLLPHELAMLSTKHRAKLIHFSTDCVFSGEKGGYRESDVPDAFDIYGRSKLLG
jgi:dTDP-4-dehydrorhamnose reductase